MYNIIRVFVREFNVILELEVVGVSCVGVELGQHVGSNSCCVWEYANLVQSMTVQRLGPIQTYLESNIVGLQNQPNHQLVCTVWKIIGEQSPAKVGSSLVEDDKS
jgi:hypothetical protein